jgi:hypothetical protein
MIINGNIVGTGSLMIGGGVTGSNVTLGGVSSTFSGGTTLTDGTLNIGVSSGGFSGPLGLGPITAAGTTLPPTIVGNGHLVINSLILNSDLNVSSLMFEGATINGEHVLNVTGGTVSFVQGVTTSGFLDKDGPGTLALRFASSSFTQGISVFAGSVQFGVSELVGSLNIGAASTVTVNSGTDNVPKPVLRMSNLNIASGGVLDLTNDDAILDYSGASPLSQISALIKSGYNSGSWTGAGITSSTAASVAANAGNPNKTAIGFAEASALGIGSFDNQGVDASTIVMRYTLKGDANLDGKVNALDFNAVASDFGASGQSWVNGDFNYDGTVSTSDFMWIATNFGQAQTSPALGSVVPEPTALGLLLFPILGRHRRARSA